VRRREVGEMRQRQVPTDLDLRTPESQVESSSPRETVEKRVRSILGKLDLAESGSDHRRVLAVLKFLEAR
jgi:hypothetical protein